MFKVIQKNFLTGLLILLPLFITLYILFFIFNIVDGFFRELLGIFLPVGAVPGLGFAFTIILILLIGLVATNVLGKKLISYAENILVKIPLVKSVYTGVKQIVDAFSKQGKEAFKRVVLIEYPRRGMFAIGFLTSEGMGEVQVKTSEKVVTVFVPTTPNPTSGFLLLVPKKEITYLDMTVEEGLKFIVSVGVVIPEWPPPGIRVSKMMAKKTFN